MSATHKYYNEKLDQFGLLWVDTAGFIPGAVHAGQEANGNNVYVARSLVANHLKTGKYVDGWGMYVSHSGQEHKQGAFQLLTNPRGVCLQWQHGQGGIVPNNAVVGGVMDGRPVYIGRWRHAGSMVVGHMTPWDGQLWYCMDSREAASPTFQILVAYGANCQCRQI